MVSVKEQGSALLMALFITAICAIITFGLLDRQRINIQRTELVLASNQAYLYAQGANIWAKDYLLTNIYPQETTASGTPQSSQPPPSAQTSPINWPKVMPTQNLPNGGSVSALLMDGQSFYNINNLLNENQQSLFIQFLQNVLPNINSLNVPVLISSLVSWVSPEGQNTNVNMEESYFNHQPAYRAAHDLFSTVSELRLVSGVSPQLYNILSPYLIALPEQTPLNINTAPAIVLTSLTGVTTLQQAQQLVAQRVSQGGFTASNNPFGQQPAATNNQQTGSNGQQIAPNEQPGVSNPQSGTNTAQTGTNGQPTSANQNIPTFTTTSNYFLLRSDVYFNHIHMTIFSLFKRELDANNKLSVNMLWQSIGTV